MPADQLEYYNWILMHHYWVKRRVREFLFPGVPDPEFQAILSAGRIEHVIQHSGHVIIFGIDSSFVRRNPVHLIRPDGSRFTSRLIGYKAFNAKDQEFTDNDSHREHKMGCLIDPSITSADLVPVGTEVLIDRTAVKDLPLRPPNW